MRLICSGQLGVGGRSFLLGGKCPAKATHASDKRIAARELFRTIGPTSGRLKYSANRSVR